MLEKFKVKNKESGIVYNAWKSQEGFDGYWFTAHDGLVPSKQLSYFETDKFWKAFDRIAC